MKCKPVVNLIQSNLRAFISDKGNQPFVSVGSEGDIQLSLVGNLQYCHVHFQVFVCPNKSAGIGLTASAAGSAASFLEKPPPSFPGVYGSVSSAVVPLGNVVVESRSCATHRSDCRSQESCRLVDRH